jgi:hypothetical protein
MTNRVGPMAIFQSAARYDGVRPINIYLLRLVYILMFFVLGRVTWTHILTHQGPWEERDAIAWCVWTAFATLASRVHRLASCSASDLLQNLRLEFSEPCLVAPIKCPLFDALRPDEPRLREDFEVFADSGVADAKFLRDVHSAHAILHQVAVDLLRKMFRRRAQPFQDLQAAWIRNCP